MALEELKNDDLLKRQKSQALGSPSHATKTALPAEQRERTIALLEKSRRKVLLFCGHRRGVGPLLLSNAVQLLSSSANRVLVPDHAGLEMSIKT